MAIENITVLFTDLVGSTQLQSSVAPDAADELRRDHFTVLRQSIAEAGGREVKNLGDGLMVVFGSASAALACAVGMQQGVELDGRARGRSIGLRVGLASGEVTREEDDYFGDPVIEAARLCAHCGGGQILATDLVRLNAGRRNPHESVPFGALELKGLPDPVETVEVRWEPVGGDGADHVELPGLLTEAGRFPFAGRQKEAELLLGAFGTVSTGATRLVLIAGEPGIGKTRLTSELAGQVATAGGSVLAGRSDELVGIPYQPFVEALRWQVAQPGGVDSLGSGAGELVRLVPELAQIDPELSTPVYASTESERMALFEAVREWLAAVAAERPVLMVLDDLHWADMGTLLLLRHVVANDPVPRLLVVGTYRDTDLDRTHPLSTVLAEFHRRADVERIALTGLDERGVTDLMSKTAGHDLDESGLALALALQEDTGGNPFFVGEVLRHLAESGSITQEGGRWVAGRDADAAYLPEGIRQVVGRRLSVLPTETQKVLSSASVIGGRFGLDLLAAATGTRPDDVLDAIEPAIDAHLVLEIGFGRYQFAHALVRSTLHGELSTTRRGRLHLAVAEALERLHVGDLDEVMAELAYHWGEAGTATVEDVAFSYARRAADLAMEQAAPDEAARWYRITRERLDGADPALDAELLHRLGVAEQAAGDPAWQPTLLDAARAAIALGDLALMVDALTVNQRLALTTTSATPANPDKIALLEEALGLIEDDPYAEAMLAYALALEVLVAGDLARRDELHERGTRLTGLLEDPVARLDLQTRSFGGSNRLITGDACLRRVAETTELLETVADRCEPELLGRFHILRIWSMFNVRPQDRQQFLDEYERHLAAHPDPLSEPFLLTCKAEGWLVDGRFDEVMAASEALDRYAVVFDNPDYRTVSVVLQLECVRELTGFAPFVDTILESLSEVESRGVPDARAGLKALVLAESGRHEEAAAMLAGFGARQFADIPDDAALPVALPCWAEAAGLVGDREACRALLELARPFEGLYFITGSWFGGSGDRTRALLSAALGDQGAAEEGFARAEAGFVEALSPPWLARTRVEWAEYRAGLGDRVRAAVLATSALDAIGDLELTVTRARAEALLASPV